MPLIRNQSDWLDTDGNPIAAHAGGMLRHAGVYYWYGCDMRSNPEGMFNQRPYQPGEDPGGWRRYFDGFNVYTSTDLVNWQHRGKALTAPERGLTTLYVSFRPHVLYHRGRGCFLMYFYYYPIYPGALLMVAEADDPLGPFRILGPVEAGSVCGHVGDTNVFLDPDGQAYVLYDDTGFDVRIDRLTDDFRASQRDGILVLERKQESPAMVYYRGRYLVAGSGVDGWSTTETVMAWARHPLGPFSQKRTISQERTWNSQITDMIHIPEADYVLVMCDQWWTPDRTDINRSRYLWLPLTFDPNTGVACLHYREQWDPSLPVSE